MAYYSHTGNTRAVAENVQKATGADIFEIIPVKPYPDEHNTLVDQAKKEIEDGVHPALKGTAKDFGTYDVIFVDSPCWWATIAPAVNPGDKVESVTMGIFEYLAL